MELYIQKFMQSLRAQYILNVETNGDKWVEGRNNSNTGKFMHWCIAAKMEVAELVDCLPWKHWKDVDKPIDVENMKIELVDIYHFLLSMYMTSMYCENRDYIIGRMGGEFNLDKFMKILRDNLEFDYDFFNARLIQPINFVDDVVYYADCCMRCEFNFKDTKRFLNKFICILELMNINYDFDFFNMCDLYLGKNILNKFRLNNGYKDGTYIKNWNGREDNVVLAELLTLYNVEDTDFIYKKLNDAYKKVIK